MPDTRCHIISNILKNLLWFYDFICLQKAYIEDVG